MTRSDQPQVAPPPVVFDKAIRLYHSAQLLLLPALWYTAEQELYGLHQYFAVLLSAMLLARLCWALFGSATARFSNFVPGPRTLWRYVRSPSQTVGHNPLSALMILALWLLLLLQVSTGLFITDEVMFEGPLYGQGPESWQAFAGFWHHNGFNVILALLLLHIGAAFWHQWRGDRVISAITRGHKPLQAGLTAPAQKPLWPYLLLVLAFLLAAHLWLGQGLWQQALTDWQQLFTP